jgi:hypothetical protein
MIIIVRERAREVTGYTISPHCLQRIITSITSRAYAMDHMIQGNGLSLLGCLIVSRMIGINEITSLPWHAILPMSGEFVLIHTIVAIMSAEKIKMSENFGTSNFPCLK